MNRDKKYTVLMTGAGGAAIPGLVKKLQNQGYRVLTADMNENAIGLYISDKGFLIPGGLAPGFLPAIREICRREKVDAVIPLVDEELSTAVELEEEGIKVLLPRKKFIETCLDKHLLMKELEKAGIGAPGTRLASDGFEGLIYPIVVKPRVGRGSRGLGLVHSEDELVTFLQSSPYKPENLLLQEYIDGPEYTISVVVWRDGKVQAVVPKEIIHKQGITRLAVTKFNSKIDEICRLVQKHLNADGPFNVQLRLNKETGEPGIFEINPRFSTSVSLTVAAGIDEIGELLKQALTGMPSQIGPWREGVVLMRQTLDTFIDISEFNEHRNRILGEENDINHRS